MTLRRWLALLALASMVFVGASLVIAAWLSHPRVRPIQQPGPLVMVSMEGLSWGGINPTSTPALWSLAEKGAVGAQAAQTPTGRTCEIAVWISIAAGTPSDVGPRPCPGPPPLALAGTTAAFPDHSSWRADGMSQNSPQDLGAPASLLAGVGQCVTGAGSGAALAAADRSGLIANYVADPTKVDLSTCPVTLISFDTMNDPALGRIIRQLSSNTTVVVVGIAVIGATPSFWPVVIAGPGVPHGVLTSLSTRQPGVIQTADLTSLLTSRAGSHTPLLGLGRPPVVRPPEGVRNPIRQVSGLVRALDSEYPFVPKFFALFLGGAGGAVLLGVIWWQIGRRRALRSGGSTELSPALRIWFSAVAAMCAATPAATLLAGLVPWWNAQHPHMMLAAAILSISALLAAVALAGPWRRFPTGPTLVLLITTCFVIAEDLVHGSRLQFVSLMGLQPVYGGRYYGQGNVDYAVFATCALLSTAIIVGRMRAAGIRRAAVVVAVFIGLTAALIDGSPAWGADGGGPLALVPAFGYLALKAGSARITWRRMAILAGITVALVGTFAVFDYLGPDQYRTHIGDFVAQVVNGDQFRGLSVIWTENWRMLTSSWLTLAVPVLLIAAAVWMRRADRYVTLAGKYASRVPFLGVGLRSVLICWVIAFATNDSGTGIPPTGLLILAPTLLLLAVAQPHSGSPTGAEAEEAEDTELSGAQGPERVPATAGFSVPQPSAPLG